jgi:hypothetical protein
MLKSRVTRLFTLTRPASISSSACRREHHPVDAIARLRRILPSDEPRSPPVRAEPVLVWERRPDCAELFPRPDCAELAPRPDCEELVRACDCAELARPRPELALASDGLGFPPSARDRLPAPSARDRLPAPSPRERLPPPSPRDWLPPPGREPLRLPDVFLLRPSGMRLLSPNSYNRILRLPAVTVKS